MKNIALLCGSFHKEFVEQMIEEAEISAEENNLNIVSVNWVPGSMEKPLILKKLLAKPEIDGVVVLGIIEKGETQHGLVMGQAVTKAIIDLQLQFEKPVGMGILGPGIEPRQIKPRLRPYAKAAVDAVAKMLSLKV
jgi:6,7-dimethyl-8-ribityllumazine synthase